MIVLFLVLSGVFGVIVGIVAGVAATPRLIARMSPEELSELARRVSRRRVVRLAGEYRAAPRPAPAAPAQEHVEEARRHALAFVDRTGAGGEP